MVVGIWQQQSRSRRRSSMGSCDDGGSSVVSGASGSMFGGDAAGEDGGGSRTAAPQLTLQELQARIGLETGDMTMMRLNDQGIPILAHSGGSSPTTASAHVHAHDPAAAAAAAASACECAPMDMRRAVVALAMVEGPERGLEALARLEVDGRLGGYHLLWAAKADLLRRAERHGEAVVAYERALEEVKNDSERRYLQARRDACRVAAR